MWSKVEGEVNK
jgi:hypothetical protein